MSANADSGDTATVAGQATELVITRVFDAPRSLVFAAWTEIEHLKRWENAPVGFTVTTEESDIRPGGRYCACMRPARSARLFRFVVIAHLACRGVATTS